MGGWHPWLVAAVALAAALAVGLAVHAVVFRLLASVAKRTRWSVDEPLVEHLRAPMRLVVALVAVQLVLPALPELDPAVAALVRHGLLVGTIAAVAWLVIAVLRGLVAHVKRRYDITAADNLEARRVHTQLEVVARTIYVFVVVVAAAAALMTIPRVRELGASLLASAGIAGIALGIAARPVLENLLAGLQIALTQPIRIDDVVIVEDEWGRVEEITAAYVVIRIWDQRRLIVPFSRFIQQPFQNWTRQSADILGTVFVHADYTVPVEAVRAELRRIVEPHPDWDGNVCVLQVTGATETTVQLRALVGATDSDKAWNLRVHVREKLIEYLQREHPGSLPRRRSEVFLDRPGDGGDDEPARGDPD